MRFSVLLAVVPFFVAALAGPISKGPSVHPSDELDDSIGHHDPEPIQDITQKPDLPFDIPEHLVKDPAVVEVLGIMKRQNFLDGCAGAPPAVPECGPGKSGGAGCV
ncbi:hypothetical protein LTR34_006243 [Exophiala xenobiotica]|nr:hypothetical protein LTR14_009019 [Exophiala xenobiotica]KAK5430516.1 hypothetical protein LTR34_006243 [Exophiala xenobiotica]KAK5474687.1 hypothetical protein LTR55_009615 [Exophiala xenobiotica]KAK5551041.1 hypothetical protein LTR46_010983 [Exophiala xenobiotica]